MVKPAEILVAKLEHTTTVISERCIIWPNLGSFQRNAKWYTMDTEATSLPNLSLLTRCMLQLFKERF